MNPTCCMIAAILLTSPAVQADDKPNKERTAKEIGTEWIFQKDSKKQPGFWFSMNVVPKNTTKLFAFKGNTTVGTYEETWNFFAAKCGSDRKWEPRQFSLKGPRSMEEFTGVIEGKTKQGEYLIVGQGAGSSMFVCRTMDYSVSVTLEAKSKAEGIAFFSGKGVGVEFTLTVAMK
jgi:hypothetical protein